MLSDKILQKKTIALSLVASLVVVNLQADLAGDISKKLNNSFMVNTTGADEWTDPGSGVKYYSGGGISISFKNSNNFTPWVDAREPSLQSGCGGFDFDAGFGSIINLTGITSQLSSAGTSFIGGFMSSILYSTPILGNIIKTVKKIADEISAVLANACSLGQQLGKTELAQNLNLAKMETRTSNYITNMKAVGPIKTAIESLGDSGVMTTMSKGLKCLGGDDYTGCMKSKDSSKGADNTVSKALKDARLDAVVTNPLARGIVVKKNYKTIPFIDRIPLKTYLSGGKSTREIFSASGLVSSSGTKLMGLLFASEADKLYTGGTELCMQARKYYNLTKKGANSDNQKAAIAKAVVKNAPLKFKEVQKLPIVVTTPPNIGVAFNPKTDLVPFILTGQVNKKDVYMYDSNIYVVQTSVGTKKVKRKIFICNDSLKSTPLIQLKWNGFGTIADTQKDIVAISKGSNKSPSTVITMEAAKLAHVLGHKEKLLNSNSSNVFAPSLTARNLAYMNNYLLVKKVIEALRNGAKTFADAAGITPDSTQDPANFNSIQDYESALKDKLESATGTERFMNAFVRDSQNVEKAYIIFNQKAKRGVR